MYTRQKIAGIDEESYDQGYAFYVNLGPFYDDVEDKYYSSVYKEER